MAAEHVRELGHERVGVLSFVRALDDEGQLGIDLSTERLAGYEEGLGSAWDESVVRTCRPNATEPARLAALELLRSESPPTAILAMSDVLALGALQAAAELGVAVPAELSVVGFDDSPAAALATPALTTVAQPHREKGDSPQRGSSGRSSAEARSPAEDDGRFCRPSSWCATAPRARASISRGCVSWLGHYRRFTSLHVTDLVEAEGRMGRPGSRR